MSIRLCNNAKSGLTLNESMSTGGRYILEGVFAELGVMNVNRRIYTEDEYLKHLQYLRDDVKKGDLLGELDHPEDRFEIRVKEVSHRIIDIWYDQNTKMVMGKIELLDTPNGRIAKEIVDAGIPLHISSRAAGTINKDNTVSIQQIYTYDIVAKPGFAKATLHRVNESASTDKYSDVITSFLRNSEIRETSKNLCAVYGFVNESAFIDELKKPAVLRKEAIEINEGKITDVDMTTLTQHINENDEDAAAKAASEAGISTPSMDPTATGDDNNDSSSNDDNNAEGGENKDEKDEKKDAFKIVKVEAIRDDESKDEDDKGEDDKSGEENTDDNKEDGQADDKHDTDDTSECKSGDCGKDKKELFDNIKSSVAERQNAFLSKFEDIKNSLKKKKEVSESLRTQLSVEFPFTMYLNESDLADFSALVPEQKTKVKNYLVENRVVSVPELQRVWKNGLNENAAQEPTWLRLASPEYRKLYEGASETEKNNLQETAKYLILESQHDVDLFWEKSNLKSKRQKQILNESFMASIPKVSQSAQSYNDLGYSKESAQIYLNYCR